MVLLFPRLVPEVEFLVKPEYSLLTQWDFRLEPLRTPHKLELSQTVWGKSSSVRVFSPLCRTVSGRPVHCHGGWFTRKGSFTDTGAFLWTSFRSGLYSDYIRVSSIILYITSPEMRLRKVDLREESGTVNVETTVPFFFLFFLSVSTWRGRL